MRILEIGPDNNPSIHEQTVSNNTIRWETLDIRPFGSMADNDLTYVVQDEYSYPIANNTFDIVLSAQVIEHVKKPWVWIKELYRITKKGGKVITIAPVSWRRHDFPVDCWRIYSEGMRSLYEDAGLRIDLCTTETLEISDYEHLIPGQSCKPGKWGYKLFIRKFLRHRIP